MAATKKVENGGEARGGGEENASNVEDALESHEHTHESSNEAAADLVMLDGI